MTDLLTVHNISKHFDGTQALQDVSLSVREGEVHALVGENGAGKSTLSKVIAGVIAPDDGEITVAGRPVRLRTPMDAQRAGVGIIFQELDLFPNLTVADNLVIGNLELEHGVLLDRRGMRESAESLLAEVGLSCPPGRLVADLSLAQMQQLAIARALGMNARLIVMDEPTSSLSDDGVENLFKLIRRLQSKGVAIIYVSHKMNEIFRIADRISVLRDGKLVSTLPASETNATQIISLMVGRELPEFEHRTSDETGEVLLQVRDLHTAKLSGISFDLRKGEILGVAGLVGSGRSSLGAALFGLDRTITGSIQLHGRPFHPRSPAAAIQNGVGLVPEDRKTQGLMMQMSITENTTCSILDRLQTLRFIHFRDERRRAAEVHRKVHITTKSEHAPVSVLSGGNQQKVLLSRWLLVDPDVLFLDDPARGIDIGAKHDIYQLLRELTAAGKGILLVSSELPELLRCSDRIMVLHEGRSMGILDRAEASQERIMSLATSVQ